MAGNRIDTVRDIGRAIPDPATTDPKPIGASADKGTSGEFSHSDHIHAIESGSWTPDFGNSTNGSGAYSETIEKSQYVKIGSFVYCTAKVILTHTATSNGNYLLIRQLPFKAIDGCGLCGTIKSIGTTGAAAIGGVDSLNGASLYGAPNLGTDAWPVQTPAIASGTSGTSTWIIAFNYICEN